MTLFCVLDKKSTKDFGAIVIDTGQWDKPTYLNNQPHLKQIHIKGKKMIFNDFQKIKTAAMNLMHFDAE